MPTHASRQTELADQRDNPAILGAYEPGRAGPVLEVAVHRSDLDGSIVVQIDTGESLSGRNAKQLRVYINDAAVYSGHVDRGNHDLQFIGDYAAELAALHRS